jgi:hypothetical protein
MNLERLDHHPLAAGRGERLPPADAQLLARCVRDIDRLVGRGQKERSIGLAKPFQRLQMPEVILVGVDGSLARQQVERGQLQVGQRFDRHSGGCRPVQHRARPLDLSLTVFVGRDGGPVELVVEVHLRVDLGEIAEARRFEGGLDAEEIGGRGSHEHIEVDAETRDTVEGDGFAPDDDVVDPAPIEGRAELPEGFGWRPPLRHAYSS